VNPLLEAVEKPEFNSYRFYYHAVPTPLLKLTLKLPTLFFIAEKCRLQRRLATNFIMIPHLLDDFKGILQADGYSGYGKVWRNNGITRIGCWDHALRKFVEATKAAKPQGKGKPTNVSKADMALSHINKLYAIERKIKALSVEERYRIRQELSVPALKTLKTLLETNVGKVAKGTLTRTAMDYTLNQWPTLVGYCERGDLHISNALAENAIRPFAVGRKA
jgi:transposase